MIGLLWNEFNDRVARVALLRSSCGCYIVRSRKSSSAPVATPQDVDEV
jgi:hypothetical protein